jgi:hypothetical protein
MVVSLSGSDFGVYVIRPTAQRGEQTAHFGVMSAVTEGWASGLCQPF